MCKIWRRSLEEADMSVYFVRQQSSAGGSELSCLKRRRFRLQTKVMVRLAAI
jgi:hypothetical protein